ncbi:Regulatory-associated protein of TOR 1 [Platanthera zijinensis]|uniref:Regulatory-associated protein of TOR 1 n=1 Tax=Platanthera zijinensis TaxID=2320716 RepID=A0AAP0B7R4_9ASPA
MGLNCHSHIRDGRIYPMTCLMRYGERCRCLHSVGLRWREWKYHVKRDNYDIYTTDEERLAIVPDRVIAGQWRTLIQYWGQEAVKAVSKQNSINREHLGGYHKMGRSSFRSVRSEMEKQGNDKVDRINVFIRTRTDKKGRIDFEAQEAIEDMNILLENVPEEERTVEYRDSCFSQVMGEDGHGRLRTWGLMRKKDLNLQPSQDAVESIRTQLREEMQSQFDIQIAEMKAQMEAQLEEKMASLQQEVRAHLERVSYPLTPTTTTSRSRVNPSIPSSTGQNRKIMLWKLLLYLTMELPLRFLARGEPRILDLHSYDTELLSDALSVGILPYVLKLLQTTVMELRQILVFIWTKILSLDKSCLVDLVKDGGHSYFIKFLDSMDAYPEERAMAAFVLAVIVDGHKRGKEACIQPNLIHRDEFIHCRIWRFLFPDSSDHSSVPTSWNPSFTSYIFSFISTHYNSRG